MKICSYCAAENRDDAAVCYFCGNRLPESAGNTQPLRRPGAGSPTPTQPRRTGSAPASDSQPTQGYVPPGDPNATQVSRPAGDPYTAPGYVPVSDPNATQVYRPLDDPYATQPYRQEYDPNATQAYPGGYAQNTGYPPPGYHPPPPGSTYAPIPQRRSRALPAILIGLLVVVFLCAGGLALWTVSAAFNKGITLTEQLSTQAAGVLPSGDAQTPRATDPAVVFEPSPWPTFTSSPPTQAPQPEPTQPPAPTATQAPAAQPTQDSPTVKLLSPECSAALDTVEQLSGQVTSQPTVALDEAWRKQLSEGVARMKTSCGTLDAASPVPGQLGEAQSKLDQATGEFDQATQLFNQGVEELNPSKLLEAGQHVANASRFLGEAIKILRDLGA